MPKHARDDASDIAKLTSTLESQIQHDYAPPAVKRDAHPKMHGCVQAELHVGSDVPEDLCHGVFARRGVTPAWIRFSNAFGIQHDLEFEARGMAVKLLGVTGEQLPSAEGDTQDFVFATHDAFFLANVKECAEFAVESVKGPLAILKFFVTHRQWRGFVALLRAVFVLARNPLAIAYFSQTPYRLGPTHVVKLQARPRLTKELIASLPAAWRFWAKAVAAKAALIGFGVFGTKTHAEHLCDRYFAPRNLLRHAMMAFLAKHDASFDILVQTQRYPGRMPIDNATIRWRPELSPFRKVATIRIPRQLFWPEPDMSDDLKQHTIEMMNLGENMSFNPWHALADHEPLGAINDARRVAYPAIANLRRRLNLVPQQAPTISDFDRLKRAVRIGQ